MSKANPASDSQDVKIKFQSADSTALLPGGRAYFIKTLKEYAEMLLSESKSIETLEHTGSGPPEITAGHVEEAKWVLIRRHRRRLRSSKLATTARIGQFFASMTIGIGASNFSQQWGALLCLAGVILGSMLLFLEREIGREA